MRIWAAFGRRSAAEPWRMQTFSVLSASRARALAERAQVQANLGCMELLVREYDHADLGQIPWTLDGSAAG